MDTNAFNELFYLKPYLKEADLEVTHCVYRPESKNYHIACKTTLFYPEGGGQAGDRGFLGDTEVFDTRYETYEGETLIMHITKEPLEVGSKVRARIDWPRRFSFMQNHSGEHILSGLCHQKYGYNNVGFHLGEDDMTLDFDGPLTAEQLEELISEANRLVFDNVPLETEILDASEAASLPYRSKLDLQGKVRLIRIPNGDLCACCGTHVSHTGEIGPIIYTKLENWKKGVRITLLCGSRALLYINEQQHILRELGQRLSLPQERLTEGLDRLEEQIAAQKKAIRDTADALWDKLPLGSGQNVCFLTLPVFDEHFSRLKAKARNEGKLLIILPNGRFFLSEDEADAEWLKILKNDFKAKGGGPAQLAQGTLPSPDARRIAEVLQAGFYEL